MPGRSPLWLAADAARKALADAGIQKQEIDGAAVRKLIAKLGKETVTIAGRTEGKNAEKSKSLGEALTSAAESASAG